MRVAAGSGWRPTLGLVAALYGAGRFLMRGLKDRYKLPATLTRDAVLHAVQGAIKYHDARKGCPLEELLITPPPDFNALVTSTANLAPSPSPSPSPSPVSTDEEAAKGPLQRQTPGVGRRRGRRGTR
ncbi:hypothetical protein PAPYR_8566 [Paratrimastix pyriformis]|uniref:Uncharacterized protein n=1 Tax=Paratrimastix pyriformis TaxID=342808 RepID=A0ABQ8UHG8_9EUKA|nr:hypothetical protein PAPYR_8566 [Paratrimastix pyriformis]